MAAGSASLGLALGSVGDISSRKPFENTVISICDCSAAPGLLLALQCLAMALRGGQHCVIVTAVHAAKGLQAKLKRLGVGPLAVQEPTLHIVQLSALRPAGDSEAPSPLGAVQRAVAECTGQGAPPPAVWFVDLPEAALACSAGGDAGGVADAWEWCVGGVGTGEVGVAGALVHSDVPGWHLHSACENCDWQFNLAPLASGYSTAVSGHMRVKVLQGRGVACEELLYHETDKGVTTRLPGTG